jgi:hypothetical protein
LVGLDDFSRPDHQLAMVMMPNQLLQPILDVPPENVTVNQVNATAIGAAHAVTALTTRAA